MEKSITIDSNMASLSSARDFLEDILTQAGVEQEDVFDVVLAVDEWISNIILHAYKSTGSGKIEINFQLKDLKCIITFRDKGESFDFHAVQEPDIKECIRRRAKSGFGICLIKKLMDEVKYSSSAACNEFKMARKLKRSKDGKAQSVIRN